MDPQFILQAFREGADGAMVLGCSPGECHYREGNFHALRRIALLRKVLADFGIEKERVKIDWVSADEGEKFVKLAREMVETVRRLGPLPGYGWKRTET
jgi:F420-non-reducing hydrogenase iron-sulfur subunit